MTDISFPKKKVDNSSISEFNDGPEKPESLTPKQRKIRESLSRFSTNIEFNPLELFDTWMHIRNQQTFPSRQLLISHITRELLDCIWKFEINDQPYYGKITVDNRIDEFTLEDEIKEKFEVDRTLNKISWEGIMQETERDYLLRLSEKQDFKFCVWELYTKCSDRRAGEIEKKLKSLLRRIDPKSNGSEDTQKIEKEFKDLRKYFSGLSHTKRGHHSQDSQFEDNLFRAEEMLDLISKDQMAIFDDIDALLS